MKDVYYQRLTKHIFKFRKNKDDKDAFIRLVNVGYILGLKYARMEYRLMKRGK